MAKFAFAHFVLLSFASGGLTQSFNGFGAYNFMRQAPPEDQQVVEVIRWRQPVCITSGPGVLPCQVNPNHYRSSQSSQSSLKEDSKYSLHQSGQRVKEAEASEDLVKKLTQDDSSFDVSSLESFEKDDSSAKRSARTPRAQQVPKLYSSRVRRFVQLENMGSSSLEEPVAKVTRNRRYLRFGPAMARASPRRQTIYVTKVVDSPVVATLVASTCLPDIGVPICDEIQNSGLTHQVAYASAPAAPASYASASASAGAYASAPVAPASYASAPAAAGAYASAPAAPASYASAPASYASASASAGAYASAPAAPASYASAPASYASAPAAAGAYASAPAAPVAYEHQHPVSYIPANSQGIASYPNYQIQYQQQQSQSTQRPDIVQTIEEFINRPNYVQTNDQPGVKPVIVVQQTPPPTFLDGINSFFMQNGSGWFNVFSRPASNNQNGGNQIVTSVVQVPSQVPSLQQIIYRPENDISDPNILTIFNQNNQPGAGPPTETPGIFGGLFAAPARPEGVVVQTTTTTTPAPSILDGISSIFRPTNRPLVIERPDKIPIVVEKPVYVVEQPAAPGLLDIFQNPNRPTAVNSSAGVEVITDPVYVLQRPTQNPPLFGLLPNNWNIFSGPTTEPNPSRPAIELTENLQQAQLVVVNDHAPASHGPVVVQSNPPVQAFPSAVPGVIGLSPVQTVSAPTVIVQQPPSQTNTSATGLLESINAAIGLQGASVNFGLGVGTISQNNPAKAGLGLEESQAAPETNVEANGVSEPVTATKFVNGEVETSLIETGSSDDLAAPDIKDRSLLTEGAEELEKIKVEDVEEQIGNEA